MHRQSVEISPRFNLSAITGVTSDVSSCIIKPAELDSIRHQDAIVIVDLRPVAHGLEEGVIPGSVHLNYDRLIRQAGVVEGYAPTPEKLSSVLSEMGIRAGDTVVAYDDETGVEAARLLWSLAIAGHQNFALLEGGFDAWKNAGLQSDLKHLKPTPSSYRFEHYGYALATSEDVLAALDSPDTVLVDTRSAGEFTGEEKRAELVGHIPGAVHFNWMDALDLFGDGGLKDPEKLRTRFRAMGVTPDKEIIVYCQSNRRSAHTFVVLKWLGFDRVRAYDGSWSEWGNNPAMPGATIARAS